MVFANKFEKNDFWQIKKSLIIEYLIDIFQVFLYLFDLYILSFCVKFLKLLES